MCSYSYSGIPEGDEEVLCCYIHGLCAVKIPHSYVIVITAMEHNCGSAYLNVEQQWLERVRKEKSKLHRTKQNTHNHHNISNDCDIVDCPNYLFDVN